jgi:hypothetical protein
MVRIGAVVLNVTDAQRPSQFWSQARADWTYPEGARFVVLADPEGNLCCVINTGRD